MLATILKGRVATQTTINIINTFVEISSWGGDGLDNFKK